MICNIENNAFFLLLLQLVSVELCRDGSGNSQPCDISETTTVIVLMLTIIIIVFRIVAAFTTK